MAIARIQDHIYSLNTLAHTHTHTHLPAGWDITCRVFKRKLCELKHTLTYVVEKLDVSYTAFTAPC